jgi:signal transduction histidine kinase
MPAAQPTRPKTVLVVDDDPFIRATTGASLRPRGFEILEAGNGREGLDMFQAHGPDLLIVDLKMPVMNGLELLAKLSDATPRTPVLVVSGEGGLDEAVEALRLGAWDYLVKPIVSPTVLLHAVDKALERAALIRENEDYRLNLERQVKERTLELQKANRELEHQFIKQQKLGIIGTLAGGMAHDFNNILASIVFSTELIRGSVGADETPDPEDLERILRVCQRGTSLIRSVLHFTGKMHEEFIHFSVRDTMLETLDIIRGTTNSRIEIKTRVAQNLGTLFGDPVHLQQILMNLTNNAIHALAGTEKPCIEISAAAYDEQQPDIMITNPESMLVVISVSDNGPGVPEEDLPRLCEPFFTTKPRDEGTGLGLFVTQKIVKTLRGKLLFSRNQTGGTIARVCLPANPGRIPDCTECLAIPDIRGNAERILIIESHPEVRASISSCLTKLGYQVWQAEDLAHGYGMIQAEPLLFDLILTDDGPPNSLDEFCTAVRQLNPAIRIMLITASPLGSIACSHHAVCRVIPKPVNMVALGQAMHHCLTECHCKI